MTPPKKCDCQVSLLEGSYKSVGCCFCLKADDLESLMEFGFWSGYFFEITWASCVDGFLNFVFMWQKF